MQRRFGYEPDQPLQGSLAICSNQVGQRFDCLSATLEMPWHNPRRPQQGVMDYLALRSDLGG